MGFSAEDLGRIGYMSNDIAMQWYALTHQQAIPGAAGTVVIGQQPGGGFGATFGAGTLLLVGIGIIGLVVLLKK